jgi:uncharacterized protein YceH (UPF0502 family)
MLIEPLDAGETRALGTLIEKSLATPDYYPMTLNALRTACNQKSSRDPVTDYDETTVSRALAGLKRKCLVAFVPYGSQGGQFKYRHFLEDVRFNLRKADLAVLAVLLLRGSQTLNEVRTRASSLHPIGSLEEAEAILKGLAGREEPLAALLPKRPGWKEPRWQDTVGSRAESDGPVAEAADAEPAEQMPERADAGVSAESERVAAPGRAAGEAAPDQAGEIEALRREVAEIKASLASLREIVESIRTDLGA